MRIQRSMNQEILLQIKNVKKGMIPFPLFSLSFWKYKTKAILWNFHQFFSSTFAGISAKMKGIICEICEKSFSTKFSLTRHMDSQHNNNTEICIVCRKNFRSPVKLLLHQQSAHNVKVDWVPNKWCNCCQEEVPANTWSYHLRTNAHKRNSAEPVQNLVKTVKSIFNERIETSVFENENDTVLHCKKTV